jgi:hypothetical protein
MTAARDDPSPRVERSVAMRKLDFDFFDDSGSPGTAGY